ncbi:MAG: hypothetical protein KDB71_17440 [Mycobacterium sp.]|nr:hypothetical protein [Mycobacterium sp.]
MNTNDDEFKEALFGKVGAKNTPKAYIAALRRLLKTSVAYLGEVDGTKRRVYWINGRSLGWLECRGSHDLGATIDGQVIQLNVAYVALKVDIDRSNDKAESGRVLSISASHGDRIKLDASPASVPDSEEREKIETFIDQVLSAIAGHSISGT